MNTIVSTNANDIHQYMVSKGIATSNEVLQMKVTIARLTKNLAIRGKKIANLEKNLKEKEVEMKEERFNNMGHDIIAYCWHTENRMDIVTDYAGELDIMREIYMEEGLDGVYDILLSMKETCKKEACDECKEMVDNFRPWGYKPKCQRLL